MKYLLSGIDSTDSKEIRKIISELKRKICSDQYDIEVFDLKILAQKLDNIKRMAIRHQNEELANQQYTVGRYVMFLNTFQRYLALLVKNDYENSWMTLQDCLCLAEDVLRFLKDEEQFDIPDILNLLLKYEQLYPYKVFASTEMGILESVCSICGESMLGFECPHIKGNLYWGEVAHEVIKKVDFQAVALVRNPLDKKCVITISDDKRTEKERFQLLDYVVTNIPDLLYNFDVEEEVTRIKRQQIKVVGRNKMCTCGSGKKFKRCCEMVLYEAHTHYTITVKEKIRFAEI